MLRGGGGTSDATTTTTSMAAQQQYYRNKIVFYQKLLDKKNADKYASRSMKDVVIPAPVVSKERSYEMHGVLFEGSQSSEETMEVLLSESIAASELRVSQLGVTKRIEQMFLFLRECMMMYRRGAEQLRGGYSLMQQHDDLHRTNFVRLFDEVSLLSLLQYKNELRSFTRNIDTMLLDNSVGMQDSGGPCDQSFSDADYALFKVSNEYVVLVDQLKQDQERLDAVFAENTRRKFEELWKDY